MLEGKVALITGAAKGIGRAIALAMAAEKATVVINYNGSKERAEQVLEEVKALGADGCVYQCNVADTADTDAMIKEIIKTYGHLDILVTAHGVQSRHPSEEFPMEDWKRVLDVNLTAVFELCQLAAKQFMAQESKGKIITVASMLSFFGGYTVPAYAASKGGVAQITKAFCNEWAEKGINVNSIAPGYMATEMNTALLDPNNPRKEAITNRIPAKRWGTAEDMKGPCVFLASDASDYLNGAVIPVDGGYLVR